MLKYLFVLILALFTPLFTETIEWQREDGSPMYGYFSKQTQNEESFPILLLIQGSQKESVLAMHTLTNDYLKSSKIAVLSFERTGYDLHGNLDNDLYNKHDYFDNRIKDMQYVIDQIYKGVFPNWNGQLFVLGASEGGAVAARLGAFNTKLDGLLLFCTGGGMPFKEEVLTTVRKWEIDAGKKESEIRFKMGLIYAQILLMKANPTTKLTFGGYSYKWWSSHLKRKTLNDIIHIRCPIYYVHGVEDELIPIESADLVAQCMKNRPGFIYKRYEGVRHAIDNLIFPVYEEAVSWLKTLTKNQKSL